VFPLNSSSISISTFGNPLFLGLQVTYEIIASQNCIIERLKNTWADWGLAMAHLNRNFEGPENNQEVE
jgi:hypothetical protein